MQKSSAISVAFIIEVGMVLSSWFISSGLKSLGSSIEKAASRSNSSGGTRSITHYSKFLDPLILKLQSEQSNHPIRIEITDKDQ